MNESFIHQDDQEAIDNYHSTFYTRWDHAAIQMQDASYLLGLKRGRAERDELLSAFKAFVSEFEGCYADGEPAMIKARAAIARAESNSTPSQS